MTILRRGLGLFAATAALLGVPFGLVTAPAQARATHVAIVVAGAGSVCVPWHSGMTGADVLTDAGYDVTWGQQPPYVGFVLQINGRGQLRPDDTHYWSYWQDTGSGWSYSARGAVTDHPQAGTVEGWSYVDGEPTATAPQASSYEHICAGHDRTPAPTTRAAPPTHPRTTRASHAPVTAQHSSAGSPTHAQSRTASSHTPESTPVAASHTRRSAGPAHTPTPSATPPSRANPLPSRANPLPAHAAAASRTTSAPPLTTSPHRADPAAHTAALPSWGTALGLLVVALIGGTALIRIRRSAR